VDYSFPSLHHVTPILAAVVAGIVIVVVAVLVVVS
jgi:hypothetical protein